MGRGISTGVGPRSSAEGRPDRAASRWQLSPPRRSPAARLVIALLLAAALAPAFACSRGSGAFTTPPPSATATVAPSLQQADPTPTSTRPAPAAQPSPAASAAPEATATQAAPAQASPAPAQPPLAGVQASISASCRSSGGHAEISVRYSISVVGEGRLTRVRLLDNGQVVDDSGPISETSVTRQKVLPGGGGATHTFQLSHEPAARSSTNTRSTVSC